MFESNNYQQHFDNAVQFLEKQQLTEAASSAADALRINSDSIECLNVCAMIARKMAHFDKAEDTWKRVVELDSSSLSPRFSLALVQREQGKLVESSSTLADALSMRFGMERVKDPMDCFCRCINQIIDSPLTIDNDDAEQIVALGTLLGDTGVFARDGAPLLSNVNARIRSGDVAGFQLLLIIRSLEARSLRDWNDKLFENVLLPGLESEIRMQRYRFVLDLEHLIYADFVSQEEKEEYFRRYYARLAPIFREAGCAAKKHECLEFLRIPKRGIPMVAFFVHTPTLLAHIQILFAYFEEYHRLNHQPFLPKVYVFSGVNAEFENYLRARSIEVVFLDQHTSETAHNAYRRLLYLRELLKQGDVTAIVWVSLPVMMVFASAVGMAPVQIWWSMKYHGIHIPEIDGYVTGGSLGSAKHIGGTIWRTAPVKYNVESSATNADAAAALRKNYSQHEILLGTLAREQKLTDRLFVETIIEILQKHTNAAFIWTGRIQLQSVQSAFERAAVADRCYFVGWVDTKVYAQLIDVFLDSFPFPCMFTLLEAMAAGKSAVLYNSEESYRTGLHGVLSPVLNGESGEKDTRARLQELLLGSGGRSFYLCAESPKQYAEFAHQLICDEAYRREVGLALQRVVEEFFANPKAMVSGYTDHFVDIIREKSGWRARLAGWITSLSKKDV